ncbi:salicylate 1-monooxygenase SalA, partial [Aspergillus bombycis]
MLTGILSRLRLAWFLPFQGNPSPSTSRDPEIPPLDIEDEPLEIAIIGCGIIGAILALGLLAKNIKIQTLKLGVDIGPVIGCDGIKSRVRELILGEGDPASYPHYTHKVAYRGLVPMEEATARLGHYRAHNQHMYGGPNAHVLHFPVAKQTLMNVVAFVTDPNDWPLDRSMSQLATKDEVAGAFAVWGPTVRGIIDLLPVELEKWGVFDSLDYPAPTYSRGRVCIAGDAAHASSPHHGAGAGIGIEDALALTVLLDMVQSRIKTPGGRKAAALQAAFAAFSTVRRDRSQWLVRSSREACEIYEWNDLRCGSDMDKGYAEIKRRSHKIWHFDID